MNCPQHPDFLKLAGGIVALLTLCNCRTMPEINSRHMTPEELIRNLGPPARIAFNKTVYAYSGVWTKGAHEYRYYLTDRRGEVAYIGYFYKNQTWLSSSMSASLSTSSPTRRPKLLNIERRQGRRKIEAFEASNPWLKQTSRCPRDGMECKTAKTPAGIPHFEPLASSLVTHARLDKRIVSQT